MVLITQQRNVTVGSALWLRLTNLHTLMFSDRYHLTAFCVCLIFSLDDGSHALDNVFQSLQDVSFVIAVGCLREGESCVL